MMHANYGEAGQARLSIADWNRTNAGTLSAILGKTGCDVAITFAVESMLPLINSFSDQAAAAARDNTIDLRCAIEIASTTSPCVRRPSRRQHLADRIDKGLTFRRVLL
jgi:hypothetical protein